MLQDELLALEVAVRNFKRAIRKELLKLLGVEQEVRAAFVEGWKMHSESDMYRVHDHPEILVEDVQDLDDWIRDTRTWRSVEEAWENSDSEELFSEPVKIRT